MKYKPDWPEARERWTALWQGREMDRPCMVVKTSDGSAPLPPPPKPGSAEQARLDPDYLVPMAKRYMETTRFGGEAIPSRLMLAGWITTHYASTPRFETDTNTIWFDPSPLDWDHPPTFDLDMDDPWFRRYEALHLAMTRAAGKDDWLIGQACVLPGNDMLALLMGGDAFLLALVDRPQWMRAAVEKLARNWVRVHRHFQQLTAETHDYWYGNAGWANFWAPEPFISTQSDISCMLSPDMFDAFIVPDLDISAQAFGSVWYHLDGPGALQHVDRLCSLDYLRVIQWVPGSGAPPNGPHWMDLYRRIQTAGKIVHASTPVENVEPLVRELDPRLLCIEVSGCESPEQADELLAAAKRWTRGG